MDQKIQVVRLHRSVEKAGMTPVLPKQPFLLISRICWNKSMRQMCQKITRMSPCCPFWKSLPACVCGWHHPLRDTPGHVSWRIFGVFATKKKTEDSAENDQVYRVLTCESSIFQRFSTDGWCKSVTFGVFLYTAKISHVVHFLQTISAATKRKQLPK